MYEKLAIERLHNETVIMSKALMISGFILGIATMVLAFYLEVNQYVKAAVTFSGFVWAFILVMLPLWLVDRRIKLLNDGPGSAGQQLTNPHDLHGGYYAPQPVLVYEWPEDVYGDEDEEKPETIH